MKNLYNQTFCLSGFKGNDAHIKKFLVQIYNAKFSETITKDTNFLITKELDQPYPSGKIKMAYRYNIPIISESLIKQMKSGIHHCNQLPMNKNSFSESSLHLDNNN